MQKKKNTICIEEIHIMMQKQQKSYRKDLSETLWPSSQLTPSAYEIAIIQTRTYASMEITLVAFVVATEVTSLCVLD